MEDNEQKNKYYLPMADFEKDDGRATEGGGGG